MITPPAIFGIESDGSPSDTTGTMTYTDSQVTDMKLRNRAEHIAKHDDTTMAVPVTGTLQTAWDDTARVMETT